MKKSKTRVVFFWASADNGDEQIRNTEGKRNKGAGQATACAVTDQR